ncbi:hypothetical protein [Natrinema sp. 74]|uniref:hypothetical protein n=1 Tax=Natrinema sp. 74 TaxID=3384159 RepID=UPI0038D3C357
MPSTARFSAEILVFKNSGILGVKFEKDVAPPWDAGEERVYEIRVVNETADTVVDAVTITIENNGS